MTFERLYGAESPLFDAAFTLYELAFPTCERRDAIEQYRALGNKDYHFNVIKENDEMVGIMFYWEIEDLIYLEHFSTIPAVRGKGMGEKALDILKSKGKTILLEIEPPEDDMTIRRYNFYQRNGFVMNPYHHIQAKYHLGDEDCELKILSYPSILSPEQYRGFYEYMTREIGIAAHKAEEFIVRPMMENDDIYQIARLIYLTDPYIYPLWFDSMEQGIKIISEMINLPTLYNKDNIMVAVDGNNHIAGITVSCQSPFCEKIDYIKQAFERAGEKMDERSLYIFDNYYDLMGKVEDGYYIANVSVDPEFRRRGIAAMLVDEIIKDRNYCTLECIVANSGTWRIYQRLGFKIAYEYPGVCDVPCYKMIYRR